MVDFNTKILGVGRLRQQRVVQDSCDIPQQVDHLHMSCTKEFSLSAAAFGEYDECWERKLLEVEYNRLIDIWKYKKDGQAIHGKISGRLFLNLRYDHIITCEFWVSHWCIFEKRSFLW